MLARLACAALLLATAAAFAQAPASATGHAPQSSPNTTLIERRGDAEHKPLTEQLAERFGFIIITRDGGPDLSRLTIAPNATLTAQQAIPLLNETLAPLGYTTLLSHASGAPERTIIRVVSLQEAQDAKAADIPVAEGADPGKVEAGDKIITQIIPLKTLDAVRLRTDLAPLVSSDAVITANGAANCIVITDKAVNVRKLMEVIAALDKTTLSQNAVRSLRLRYSNAADAARLINEVFNPQNNRLAPLPGAAPGPAAAATQRAARVFASSDPRTNTVVITGPKAAVDQAIGLLSDNDLQGGKTILKVDLQNVPATSAAPVVQQVLDHTPGK